MFNTVSLDHEIVHGMKAPRTVISALVLFFCLCFIETKIYLVETESFDNKGEFKLVIQKTFSIWILNSIWFK